MLEGTSTWVGRDTLQQALVFSSSESRQDTLLRVAGLQRVLTAPGSLVPVIRDFPGHRRLLVGSQNSASGQLTSELYD